MLPSWALGKMPIKPREKCVFLSLPTPPANAARGAHPNQTASGSCFEWVGCAVRIDMTGTSEDGT